MTSALNLGLLALVVGTTLVAYERHLGVTGLVVDPSRPGQAAAWTTERMTT